MPEMRIRLVDGALLKYDKIAPSFTVAKNRTFDICRVEWNDDPGIFCKNVRGKINSTKDNTSALEFADKGRNVYYFSCLPWLDFQLMSDPIPDDIEIASIPRICWGKYTEEGGKYSLN